MYATLDSTPGVISQIFPCTNAPSGVQRRPLRYKTLYLRTVDVPPKSDYTFRESFATVHGYYRPEGNGPFAGVVAYPRKGSHKPSSMRRSMLY